MKTINEVEARIVSHEEICAFRYEQINARLKRLEQVLIKASGALLVMMAGMIFTFLTK
jgi:hypothetical protein